MKKMIKFSIIASMLSISALSASASTQNKEPEKVVDSFSQIEKLNKHFEGLEVFKSMNVDFVSNKQIGDTGMYILKGKQPNGSLVKIISDKNGEYLVIVDQRGQAQVADVKNKKALSTPVDMSIVKSKKEAFTYGTGSKQLYVFTDPECPVCKEFEKTWDSIKNDVTLHVYFYNLDYHKEANNMTKYIMAGKTDADKASRLIDIANGKEDYKTAKLTDEEEKVAAPFIIDGKEIGNKIIIEGTPTVLDSEGNSVNWPELIPQPKAVPRPAKK